MDESRAADVRRSLDLWADFPVDVLPRPLVLNGPQVLFDGGFNDDDAKMAFLSGAVESEVELAPGVLKLLRAGSSPWNSFSGGPLRITAATAVAGTFSSDRGRARLPAWQLTVSGATRPFIVRDPATAHWWPARWDRSIPREPVEQPSRIDPNGTLLSYVFSGTPLTYGRYTDAEVFETEHAVHVSPSWQWNQPRPETVPLVLAGGLHLDIRLERPLASRVLITSRGQPLTVLPN